MLDGVCHSRYRLFWWIKSVSVEFQRSLENVVEVIDVLKSHKILAIGMGATRRGGQIKPSYDQAHCFDVF